MKQVKRKSQSARESTRYDICFAIASMLGRIWLGLPFLQPMFEEKRVSQSRMHDRKTDTLSCVLGPDNIRAFYNNRANSLGT